MARPGGNPNLRGNKNSGRRPISEEMIKKARELHYKELSKEAVSRYLQAMIDDPKKVELQEVKDIALPIVLKTMAEKREVDFKDVSDEELNNKIAEIIEGIIS